jgi:hypothetical protein
MNCSNHPEIAALDRCVACAEPFCGNCLVRIREQHYCARCKVVTMASHPPAVEMGLRPCEEANQALKYAIVSIFCIGIIVAPVAMLKAKSAKQMIAADPTLTGSGKANAAMVIGVIVIILSLVGLITGLATDMESTMNSGAGRR